MTDLEIAQAIHDTIAPEVEFDSSLGVDYVLYYKTFHPVADIMAMHFRGMYTEDDAEAYVDEAIKYFPPEEE